MIKCEDKLRPRH